MLSVYMVENIVNNKFFKKCPNIYNKCPKYSKNMYIYIYYV